MVYFESRGVHLVVPHALQVGGLTAGLARRDEEVAAVLHHQRHHVEVGSIRLEGSHALVGLQAGISRLWQRQADAVGLLLVLFDMIGQQLLVGLALDTGQRLVVLLHRRAADVLVVHEVGGSGDIERRGGGIVDGQLVNATFHFAVGLDHDAALGLQSGLDALLLHAFDDGSQFIDFPADALMLGNGKHLFLQLGGEINIELQLAFLRSLQLHDDDVVGLRGKDGALVLHTFIYIRCGGGGVAEVQRPLIFLHVLMA